MNSKAYVTLLAMMPILLSLIHIAFQPGKFYIIIINVVLAVFMILGYNWARWVTLVRCCIGVIAGLVELLYSLKDFSIFLILFSLLQLVLIGFVGANLLLSKRVNEHFNT